MVLYEILTNERPAKDYLYPFKFILELKNGYRPEFRVSIPSSYKDLITSCWREEPSSRPSFKEIVKKLREDPGFITDQVNKKQFDNYVKYIDEFKTSFGKSLIIDLKPPKSILPLNRQLINEYFSLKLKFIPYKKFIELPERCRKIVLEAGDDDSYTIGKYLIEGQELFPRWTILGLKYLKESMKSNCVEAIIYYCELLISGKIIHENIKKAKKILEKKLTN